MAKFKIDQKALQKVAQEATDKAVSPIVSAFRCADHPDERATIRSGRVSGLCVEGARRLLDELEAAGLKVTRNL